MVLAAGLGTRLRPLTFEISKPMVPVLDRPVMAHILDHLHAAGITEVIANLHHFPDEIQGYFGDELSFRFEEALLGTAGGVRNCADFLTGGDDDSFLIISGDALTDIDLERFVARHREAGGIATLAGKRVSETSEYGVMLTGADGRISGFQEKPEPAEALSDLANCGMYLFRSDIFDYFPAADFVDWAKDVFPALLENDVPFHVHDLGDEYWNDVGSLDELRGGTFDALHGRLTLAGGSDSDSVEVREGLFAPPGAHLDGAEIVEGLVWVGRGVRVGEGVRLQGPVVLGDEVVIGERSSIRESIVLPGTEVNAGSILIGAIAGHAGIVAALRPRR